MHVREKPVRFSAMDNCCVARDFEFLVQRSFGPSIKPAGGFHQARKINGSRRRDRITILYAALHGFAAASPIIYFDHLVEFARMLPAAQPLCH